MYRHMEMHGEWHAHISLSRADCARAGMYRFLRRGVDIAVLNSTQEAVYTRMRLCVCMQVYGVEGVELVVYVASKLVLLPRTDSTAVLGN